MGGAAAEGAEARPERNRRQGRRLPRKSLTNPNCPKADDAQGQEDHPAHSSRRTGSTVPAIAGDRLLGDIRALIEAAREQTARAVNSALVGLYWHIGNRIRQDVLKEKRAEYGERDCVDAVCSN